MSTIPPANQHSAIECRIIRETDAAILVDTVDAGEVWLPISQVSYIGRASNDAGSIEYPDILHVANWILAKRGLI